MFRTTILWRSLLWVLLSATVLVGEAQEKILLPIQQGKLWGFIDGQGELVIPAKYEGARFCGRGYALIQQNNLLGLIDSNGMELLPAEYEDLELLDDTTATFRSGEWWGVLNLRTLKKIEAAFHEIKPMKAWYMVRINDRYGLLDQSGKPVLETRFEYLASFKPGWVHAKREGKFHLIAPGNTTPLPYPVDSVDFPRNSGPILFRKDTAWGALSLASGDSLLPPTHRELVRLPPCYLLSGEQGNFQLFNANTGQWLTEERFEQFYILDSNHIVFSERLNSGLLRTDGTVLFPAKYSGFKVVAPGYYSVCQLGKWGLARDENNWLHQPRLDFISEMDQGVAKIILNKKQGLINESGKILLPPKYESITLVGNTAKAYPDSGKAVVFRFDSRGEMADVSSFNQVRTVSLQYRRSDRNRFNNRSAGFSGIRMRRFIWVYDQTEGLWGLRNITQDRWQIKPTYKSVEEDTLSGLTLTTIELDNPNDFRTFKYVGLVDHIRGFEAVEAVYRSIVMADFHNAGQTVGRAVNREGSFELVSRFGNKMESTFTFVGSFDSGKARFLMGGRLAFPQKKYPESIMTLDELDALRDGDIVRGRGRQWAIARGRGRWGYISKTGKVILSPKYDFAGPFIEDRAVIKYKDKWGVIDTLGGEVVPSKYAGVRRLNDAEAPVFELEVSTSRWGLMNGHGHFLIPQDYNEIAEWSEERLLVRQGRKWGYVDETGQLAAECQYKKAQPFSEGLAAVRVRSKWGYIDPDGNMAIEPAFQGARPFSEGMAGVNVLGKWGFIGPGGNLVIEPRFRKVEDFVDGVAIAASTSQMGLINTEGKWVLKPKYMRIERDPSGILIGLIDNRREIISRSGEVVPGGRFLQIDPFIGELATFRTSEHQGVVNTSGEVILPAIYNKIELVTPGCVAIKKGGYWGMINLKGDTILPLQYGQLIGQNEGIVILLNRKGNGLYSAVDDQGKVLFEGPYHGVSRFSSGKAVAGHSGHGAYYVDRNGKMLFGQYYEKASLFHNGHAVAYRKGIAGLISETGFWTVQPQFQRIVPLKGPWYKAGTTKLYGLADFNGKVLAEPVYNRIQLLREDILRLNRIGKTGYLRPTGDWILQPAMD